MPSKILFLAFFLGLGGCALTKPPVNQMVVASAAMKAADRAQAEKRSPDLFRKAENAYWKAQRFYTAREYADAVKESILARRLAEQAELDSDLRSASDAP